MDAILIVSKTPDKYEELLKRLGYQTLIEDCSKPNSSICTLLEERIIDLLLIDSNDNTSYHDIITFFREQELTKALPILVIGDFPIDENDERIMTVTNETSLGVIASRIATLLRVRKMDGKSPEAHIADLNAALRDFSEKFTRDLEEAQKIQISTLPREVPKGENFEIAYSYQPLEELGGDWFYLHNENDGSISIVIADVTGHGLAAALIGGWIKLAFWATADITDPASRLNLLNSLITPQLPDGRFITISFINYHPVSQVLKQARGGHPPTLIYKSATDQTGELMGHGFALGFMEDGEYELIESTLESGDTVVLCTDGIVEAQNMNSQFYGTAGIIKTLSRIKPLTSADETKNMILEDLNSFTNGRIIKDDVTLIVLKCLH